MVAPSKWPVRQALCRGPRSAAVIARLQTSASSKRRGDFEANDMSGKTVWFFVKIFAKEEHADQFIKGGLHLNRLSYFKKIENDDDGRPDKNEAVAMWLQPYDFTMTLNVPGVGETKITSKDLNGPVSMSSEYNDHFHILCLYAMSTVSLESLDQQATLAENEAELQRQFRIDERCVKFGQFAVVVQAVPFRAQLKEALQHTGQWFK